MTNTKFAKIEPDFITEEEAKILSNWTLSHYKEPYFMNPKMNNDKVQTRFTTRHAYSRTEEYKNFQVKYPKEVYEIQKRIFKYLNLTENNIIPFPSFTDGIVTTIGFSPGSCISHKDPVYYQNTYTLHCNFCTQNPESGGITILEGKEYSFEHKDMIMYVASHVEHEVTECVGNIPRVLWVFGFCISLEQMNRIFNIKSFTYH
jgi:hypothetical protein